MDDLLLIVNLGLKSIRSIVFDWRGEKLAFSSRLLETSLKDDRVEQDPEEWWGKAQETIREVLSKRNLAKRVRYITVTASSSCLVAVGDDLKALCPAIMVSDRRAEAQAQALSKAAAFAEVKEITGLESNPSLMLPKIMWLKDEEPDVFSKTRFYLSPNDYVIAQFTGEVITDHFDAQKFHYDANSKTYPSALFAEIGIRDDQIPPSVSPGQDAGCVLPGVAADLGLRADTRVIVSTYDAICAFFGSGVSDLGEACDVSGTVSSLRVLTPKNINDPSGRTLITPFADDGVYIVGGSNNMGGGLIEWAKQALYSRDEFPYQAMEEEARGVGVGADGLTFLPYLMGERAPVWDVDARGVFFGIERYHGRADMACAVFESTAFAIRHLMEAIEDAGAEIKRIRVSGGLTRIALVQSLKADITGREIAVVDEFETTALGAAMLVGRGIGIYTDIHDAAKMSRIRLTIHPDPERHAIYEDHYQLYRETYQTLKPLFKKRAAILAKQGQGVETTMANL